MEENTLMPFPNLERVLEEYGKEVRNKYQDKLIQGGHIATGDLLNNVEFEIKHEGTSYKVGLNLDFYWKYIEEGVKGKDTNQGAKFPNGGWGAYYALKKWITVKPVLPRPMSNGKLPTLSQLAGAITASYVSKGTEAKHYLKETTNDVNKEYMDRIQKAFMQDVIDSSTDFIRLVLLSNTTTE